ncbi:hypothetical protein [Cupriavidus basilensis]
MAISKKQKAAIAAMIIVGVLASGAVLFTGRSSPGSGEEGHGHAEHPEAQGHQDDEHHGPTAKKGHKDDNAHADEEHHEAAKKGPHGGNLYTRERDAIEQRWPKQAVRRGSDSGDRNGKHCRRRCGIGRAQACHRGVGAP